MTFYQAIAGMWPAIRRGLVFTFEGAVFLAAVGLIIAAWIMAESAIAEAQAGTLEAGAAAAFDALDVVALGVLWFVAVVIVLLMARMAIGWVASRRGQPGEFRTFDDDIHGM